MKWTLVSLAVAGFFSFSVHSENSIRQIGVSYKNSHFGSYFRNHAYIDSKDIEDQFKSLGVHWGIPYKVSNNLSTASYIFFDYGSTDVLSYNQDVNLTISRQLTIAGVGHSFQYHLNDTFYVKFGAELGLYNDKFSGDGKTYGFYNNLSLRNTGSLFSGSIATGVILTKHWDVALGYKHQYLPGNKFDELDFTRASQLFFGINYNY